MSQGLKWELLFSHLEVMKSKKNHNPKTLWKKQPNIFFIVPIPSHISISEKYHGISLCILLKRALQDTCVCLWIRLDILLCNDPQPFESSFPEAAAFGLACCSPSCLLSLPFMLYSAYRVFWGEELSSSLHKALGKTEAGGSCCNMNSRLMKRAGGSSWS